MNKNDQIRAWWVPLRWEPDSLPRFRVRMWININNRASLAEVGTGAAGNDASLDMQSRESFSPFRSPKYVLK